MVQVNEEIIMKQVKPFTSQRATWKMKTGLFIVNESLA